MKIKQAHLIAGSTFGSPNDSEALMMVRAIDIHHSDIPKAIMFLPSLIEAASAAQCECTASQRDSGHKLDCWFPALQEALEKYRRLEYTVKAETT